MTTKDFARFATFESYDPEDLQAFQLLTGPRRTLLRRQFLRHEGQANPEVYRLKSGWLCCSIMTVAGDRQITKVYLPGELVGMSSLASRTAAETITALSDAAVEVIPLEALATIFQKHPRLAALLFLWSQEERVRLMQQLTLVGRVPSANRLAAFLLSLYLRVQMGDPEPTDSFPLPLTQQDIADATGMSVVHANRSLRILNDLGLLTLQKGVATVRNLDGLHKFSGIPVNHSPRSTAWL